jgi:hypothetical protein
MHDRTPLKLGVFSRRYLSIGSDLAASTLPPILANQPPVDSMRYPYSNPAGED